MRRTPHPATPRGPRGRPVAASLVAGAVLWLCTMAPVPAGAQPAGGGPRVLGREDILLYGLGLRVEPATQVVPKDIATIVSPFLQAPALPGTTLPPFDPDAEVRATLRGPSLAAPVELSVRPNTPFTIPPLTVPGVHTLENIRLVSRGEVLLYGSPQTARIEVIERLLVTQVVSRPLTAAEIREKGIVFDRSSFQAYNFTAAFAVAPGQQINVSFPVVLPNVEGADDPNRTHVTLPTVDTAQLRTLSTIVPDTLKIQTQIPNLQVVGFALRVPTIQGQNFFVPPIPGVIVIPGDIGFLNQYFSVLLLVSNVAPDGSNLVVSDLQASLVLPPGRDEVVGTGDDPLRMAQTAQGESPRVRAVTQPGSDGRLGTADDIATIAPGETGNAEFLVEGRREGSHVVEMELAGTLHGLPVGPVPIRGRAAGSVLVRNPSFTLTFVHPDTVVAGERYTLDVTVTNTSESPANFVSLSLHEANLAGATLAGPPTREIETIPPGDSTTVGFDLVARVSGKVTAATLEADGQVQGRFLLKSAVGELGVPLSPESLVLPKEAGALPPPLREAAVALLGKAWSVATAPPAALPKDLVPFSRKIVLDRAVEVAAAGLRVSLHEPVDASAAHLLMEFAGSDYARLETLQSSPDDIPFARDNFIGFDLLRRRSVRGDAFAGAVGSLLGPEALAQGAAAYHLAFAQRVSYRPPHLSVLVLGSGGAAPPVNAVLRDASGQATGPGETTKILKQIPFSDWLRLTDASGTVVGHLALVTTPVGDYTIELVPDAHAPPGARYTLSLVLPGPDGRLRQIVYEALEASEIPRLDPTDGEPHRVTFTGASGAAGPARLPSATITIDDPPPSVISVVQQIEADVIRCEDGGNLYPGRVVAALFSEEVTPASAQDKAAPEAITAYTAPDNRVVGVALQPGRRIVFLALRDPVGPFEPASITFEGIEDLRGQAMPVESRPVEITARDEGGVVAGRVLRADGTPVPFATLRLFYVFRCGPEVITVGISQKPADADGRFSWGYVLKAPGLRLTATDDETGDLRDVRFRLARDGQRMDVNVVFLGRGTLEGRTLAEDGVTPLADVYLKVTSLTDNSEYGARSDEQGRFLIPRLPVGNIFIEAVDPRTRSKVFLSELIPAAGAIVERDLVLLGVAPSSGTVTLRTGTLAARVVRADGTTPAPGLPVYAFYQDNSQPGIRCPKPGDTCPVAAGTTDADGRFVFESLVAGAITVKSLDQGLLQEGAAAVILPADGRADVIVLLSGGLGTVRGVVLDPSGAPVAGARVGGGLSLATTDAQGRFVLTDVPTGRREIVAVSDALATKGSVFVDVLAAGEEVGATIVLSAVGSVAGTIVGSDGVTPQPGVAVYLIGRCETGGGVCVHGQATTDDLGRYRIDGVRVLQNADYRISAFAADFSDGNVVPVSVSYFRQVVRADVRFRGSGGTVTGTVFDEDGATPLRAAVSISGDQVVVAGGRVGIGFQRVENYRITETDPVTGRFAFGNVLVGPFTVRAAGQFSPDPIAVNSEIPSAGATVNLRLALQPKSAIRGTLFEPDGVTPVQGRQVPIRFKSRAVKVFCSESSLGESQCVSIPQGIQELTVVTNEQGVFSFPLVNPGPFTLSAEDVATGRTGHLDGAVKAGETAEVDVRLVGRGAVTVRVFSANRDAAGNPVPVAGARVEVSQLAPPQQRREGTTDASGIVRFAGADAFGEGAFVVSASRTGFAGRAAGRVQVDGEEVTVDVFLGDSTGRVSGQVFRADGLTPVPNAEVSIASGGAVVAFAVTDADGRYSQDFIAPGPVRVEVFEAATAQRGAGTSQIFFNGQEVVVNVRLEELAVVRGTVVEAGSLAPLRGWTVRLSQTSPSGVALPALVTSTGVDGTFAFPGAAVGSFRLSATGRDVAGSGQATGVVERPGQLVDVPIVVTIARPALGRVTGVVLGPGGLPAPGAQVSLAASAGSATTSAASDGTFAFEQVGLGRFTVSARAQVTGQAGSAMGELAFDGATADVVVVIDTVSRVSGTVFRPGPGGVREPAGRVEVRLATSPAGACAGGCTTFADDQGRFSFPDLAARAFSIFAVDPITQIRGAAGGTLVPGGDTVVEVLLEPAGSVTGRAIGGGRPQAGVVARLESGSGARLFVETDADGVFGFPAVPLGRYTLSLEDPVGSGLARRLVDVNGVETLGDLVLDEAPPAVVATDPAGNAVNVPLDQPIRITFSEPVNVGTVSAGTVSLAGPAGAVTGVVSVDPDETTASFTPLARLAEQTRYTLRVAGVRDRLGREMARPHVVSFTTVDLTPPSIVEITPAPGTSGAPIYTPVRVVFSEPVDPARYGTTPPVTMREAGTRIDGRIDFTVGDTTVVFTPLRPLAEDRVYEVVIAAAADRSGNRQAEDRVFVFSTTDRTPPVVTALEPVGGPTVIEQQTKQVVASVGTWSDVAFVDFFVNGVFVATARTVPYTLTFQATPAFGRPGDTLVVSAVATDTSGNRGTVPATVAVTIVPDAAPAVAITSPPNGSRARNGDRVTVTVRATDDVGVAQVAFRAATGVAADAAARNVSPPAPDRTETFGFDVPPTLAPGARIVVEAQATDTSGKVTGALPIEVEVLDGVRPTVQIGGASSGARVRPGQTVTVVVSAADLGGVATIGFAASGAASLTETRAIDPALASVATSFTFTVSPAATPTDRVFLDAFAVDRAGNRRDADRVVLAMADEVPPAVQIRTADGRLDMVPGRSVTVVAEATDETGVSRITLAGSGAFALTDAKTLVPPTTPASATFIVNVPASVLPGQTLTLTARAIDLSGNTSDPASIVLTARALSDVSLPASVIVLAGDVQPVTLALGAPAPEGGVVVSLASAQSTIATVPSAVVFAPGEREKSVEVTGVSGGTTSVAALIDGVSRASMTVTVRGGVVRGRVLDPAGQPAGGADVTVLGGAAPVTTMAGPDGRYFVEGVAGPGVTVRARSADGLLQGETVAQMNRANGFATADVVLVEASTVRGTVRRPDDTAVGTGARVELFLLNATTPAATTFTDESGAYRFGLVGLGTYRIEASDLAGNRGRATVQVISGGQDLVVPVVYLGRGTVTGVVLDGGGNPAANVPITFRATSVFGSATPVNTSSDADGRFRFDGVFVGTFSVEARDPVSGAAGQASGSLAADGEVREVQVRLTQTGTITGTVFRYGGVQPVGAGVQVSLGSRTTQTDTDGRYTFEFVPLGTVTVSVTDPASRARGVATATLAANGEVRTVDVVLAGQGTLVVRVVDSTGADRSGAYVEARVTSGVLGDVLAGTTGADGLVVLERLLAGAYSVSARYGTLAGSASGVLAPGEVREAVVTLAPPPPTGSIRGTVFAPNGQSPVTAGQVRIGGRTVAIGPDGTYRLDDLPLGPYQVDAYDAGGVLRARQPGVVLRENGEVVTVDLVFVAMGTVTGTVFYPDGSSAAGLQVRVQSFHPTFGGTRTATTNAGGVYTLASVPAGAVTARTEQALLGFLGDAAGTLVEDGQTLVLDIVLTRDGVRPSAELLAPADGATVAPGGSVGVTVRATDNVGVTQIRLAWSGVLNGSDTRTVSGQAVATMSFSVAVPAGTPPGALVLSAVARDGNGNESDAVSRTVTVLDTTPPVVSITAPAPGAVIDPREPLEITVRADDPGRVAQVSVSVTGSVSAAATRSLPGTETSATETFSVPFTETLPIGGTATISATARDVAGHTGSAAPVVVTIRDVVGPTVVSVAPADGATGVDTGAVIAVTFSEAVDPASTGGPGGVRLLREGVPVVAAQALQNGDRTVTLTPEAPLALNTLYSVAVGTGVRDRAGNPLAAPVTSSFRTVSPDTTPPRVQGIVPAGGAVDVPLGAAIEVTFTEAVDPATITAQSFRASIGGTPVAGTRTMLRGDTAVRFTPDAPWPAETVVVVELTDAIADPYGNRLADQSGAPLAGPLTFTFLTAQFSLTSPRAGTTLVENSQILLEARASASLGVAAVVYTVNGQALAPAPGPAFQATTTVPSLAVASTLTVVASGRSASGAEVARDERTFPIAFGIRTDPRLVGVAPGATASFRIFTSSVVEADLPVALAAADPAAVSVPATVTIPAGSSGIDVPVTGAGGVTAARSTTITATSTRGTADVIVSVSPVPAQTELTGAASPVGVLVRPPLSLGAVFYAVNANALLRVAVLPSPAAGPTTVALASSDPAVASVPASLVIPAGERFLEIPVATGRAGTAALTLRADGVAREVTVYVGTPPADAVPAVVTPLPVGVNVRPPLSLGTVFAALSSSQTVSLPFLPEAAAVPVVVSIASSDPTVAGVPATVTIPAGQTTVQIPIVTGGSAGSATLTLQGGGIIRVLTVFAGQVPADQIPPAVSQAVGVQVLPPLSLGTVFTPVAGVQAVRLVLFDAPVASPVTVQLASSDPAVASVPAQVVVNAGERVAEVPVTSGGTPGEATITLNAGSLARQLTVIVGPPPADRVPPAVAPPVGVGVLPLAAVAHVAVPTVGAAPVVAVQLVNVPAAVDRTVTVSSSDPAVATVAGAVVLRAGERVATFNIVTGQAGVAVLRLEFDGETRELVVVVGTVPPDRIPAVTAPVVGVRVGP
jgi:hypothetical protein